MPVAQAVFLTCPHLNHEVDSLQEGEELEDPDLKQCIVAPLKLEKKVTKSAKAAAEGKVDLNAIAEDLLPKELHLENEVLEVVAEEAALNSCLVGGSLGSVSINMKNEQRPSRANGAIERECDVLVLGWEKGFNKAMGMLKARSQAFECTGVCESSCSGVCKLGFQEQMSVVEVWDRKFEFKSVEYIKWTSERARLGRVVDIDEHGGVIAIVYVGDKQEPKMYDGTIVHPAVGVKYRKIAEGKNECHKLGLFKQRVIIPDDIHRDRCALHATTPPKHCSIILMSSSS